MVGHVHPEAEHGGENSFIGGWQEICQIFVKSQEYLVN